MNQLNFLLLRIRQLNSEILGRSTWQGLNYNFILNRISSYIYTETIDVEDNILIDQEYESMKQDVQYLLLDVLRGAGLQGQDFSLQQQQRLNDVYIQRYRIQNEQYSRDIGRVEVESQMIQEQDRYSEIQNNQNLTRFLQNKIQLEQIQRNFLNEYDSDNIQSKVVNLMYDFVNRLWPKQRQRQITRVVQQQINEMLQLKQQFMDGLIRSLRYDVMDFLVQERQMINQDPLNQIDETDLYPQSCLQLLYTLDKVIVNTGSDVSVFILCYVFVRLLGYENNDTHFKNIISMNLTQRVSDFIKERKEYNFNAEANINIIEQSLQGENIYIGKYRESIERQNPGQLIRQGIDLVTTRTLSLQTREQYKQIFDMIDDGQMDQINFLTGLEMRSGTKFSGLVQYINNQRVENRMNEYNSEIIDILQMRALDLPAVQSVGISDTERRFKNIVDNEMSGIIKLMFFNIYQSIYNSVQQNSIQIRSGYKIIRIDYFVSIQLKYQIGNDYNRRGMLGNFDLDTMNELNNGDRLYRYSTLRFTVKDDMEGGMQTPQQLRDQSILELLRMYLTQLQEYGEDEDFDIDPQGAIERLDIKPMIWTVRDRNIQVQNNIIPRNDQRIEYRNYQTTLLGFLTDKEYQFHQSFVLDEYDIILQEYDRLFPNQKCIIQCLIYIICNSNIDQEEQILIGSILNGDRFQLNVYDNDNVKRIKQMYRQCDGNIDIVFVQNFLKMYNINYVLVQMNEYFSGSIQNLNQDFIICLIDNHIFIGDKDKLKNRCSIDQILSLYETKKINRLFQIYGSKDKFHMKKFAKDWKIQRKKLYCNIFFDFETTCDPNSDYFIDKQVKAFKSYSRDQITCAVSYLFDIQYDIQKYAQLLVRDKPSKLSFDFFKDKRFDSIMETHEKAQVIFQTFCERPFFKIIQELQQKLLTSISQFNTILLKQKDKKYTKYLIDCKINIMSFNGSKFDNHFMLRAIKDTCDDWTKKVKITGDLTEMKIMQYEQLIFLDLKLMMGATTSLREFLKSFDIKVNKLDIEIEVFESLESVQRNKDRIIEYCGRDTEVLLVLYNTFKQAISHILYEYVNKWVDMNDKQEQREKLNTFIEKSSVVKSQQEYFKTFFPSWCTISTLSLNIFKSIFCDFHLIGCDNQKIYDTHTNSYFGGYTQSFWIGKNLFNERIFYLDFNSMYPYVMRSLLFPTNFSKTFTYEEDIQVQIYSYDEYIKWRGIKDEYIDPLSLDTLEFFNLNMKYGDYDLFTIQEFRFKQDVFSPQFPIMTKKYGTINPVTFNLLEEKDDLRDNLQQGIPIFGFQLRRLFYLKELEYVNIIKRTYQSNRRKDSLSPIFRLFDDFLYNTRLSYKSTNKALAQSIKILINSLYGKFGQNIFDVSFVMDKEDYEDPQKLFSQICKNIHSQNSIELFRIFQEDADLAEDYEDLMKRFMNMNIKERRVNDVSAKDSSYVNITLENAPHYINHTGSLKYISSLITAVSRSLINKVIYDGLKGQRNSYIKDAARVYYCDTDSVLVNQQAFDNIQKTFIIDSNKLGALKDEYPNDIVTEICILNKKVYMYKIGDKWNVKFKGVKNPSSDMYECIKNNGSYDVEQIRFKKNFGNVSISDMLMINKCKIPRRIIHHEFKDQEGNTTLPFNSITDFNEFYKNKKTVIFDQQSHQWINV